MYSALDNSLRKVAILVACLDEEWGERILAQFPAVQAEHIRRLLRQLVEIDPTEQEEIVAEFRRSLQPATPETALGGASAGVELDLSLQTRIDAADYPQPITRRRSPLEEISTADVSGIVELLSQEHPQTVALVVSRLEPAQAAELLLAFSPQQQADILNRLAALDSTDEQAVAVVESQVGRWIVQQRHRKQRLAVGLELVELILAETPPEQRTVIAARMGRLDPQGPTPLQSPTRQPATPPSPVSPSQVPRQSISLGRALTSQALTATPAEAYQPLRPANPFRSLTADECRQALEKLDGDSLLRGLGHCETRVATLALLGASETVLKRVQARLPRQAGRGLRQALRDVGPTRLSDILNAQQQVLLAALQE